MTAAIQTMHPATVLWQAQRAKCKVCTNVRIKTTALRCAKTIEVRGACKLPAYCIDARLEGAECGPSAVLWKERQ